MMVLRSRWARVAVIGTVGLALVVFAVGMLTPRPPGVDRAGKLTSERSGLAPGARTAGGGLAVDSIKPTAGSSGAGAVAGRAQKAGERAGTATFAPSPDGPGSARTGPPVGVAPAGPRIVKSGAIDVEVRKHAFGPSFARLTSLATGLGGFVADSRTNESADVPNGTVTLRVASDRFDDLVRQVRELGKVLSLTSSGQDVTGHTTDLQARLRALGATRDQLLALLTRANSISDTLAVRDRLNEVQTQIEQIQGQLAQLDDQAALATLAVTVTEPGFAVIRPETPRSGWAQAWDDAGGGFERGAQAIVARSGAVLLLLICAALLALPARAAWRATRRPPEVVTGS